MIPPVVSWRVRLIRDGQTVAEVCVKTINRRFAWWLTLDNWPRNVPIFGTQVKISRMK